jgi:hypothetical protein
VPNGVGVRLARNRRSPKRPTEPRPSGDHPGDGEVEKGGVAFRLRLLEGSMKDGVVGEWIQNKTGKNAEKRSIWFSVTRRNKHTGQIEEYCKPQFTKYLTDTFSRMRGGSALITTAWLTERRTVRGKRSRQNWQQRAEGKSPTLCRSKHAGSTLRSIWKFTWRHFSKR